MTVLLGCSSNVKTLYSEAPFNPELRNDPTLKKLNATGSDKCIVFFTGGFANDTIQLISGKTFRFKKSFTTGDNTGLANYEVINNEEDVEISILSIDTRFVLKEKVLKKYKCVYVSKNGKDISVEYSNTFKRFL